MRRRRLSHYQPAAAGTEERGLYGGAGMHARVDGATPTVVSAIEDEVELLAHVPPLERLAEPP